MPELNLGDLKGVIFDLDGVLFDSKPSNVAFYNHILDEMGLPPMQADGVEVAHRESSYNTLLYLLGEGADLDRAMSIYEFMDTSRFIPKIQLFPNASRCLHTLAGKLDLAVATNRAKTTRLALEHFGLWHLFKVVVTPIEAEASKPDPIFVELCLQGLGMNRDQVVYVGDSSVDEALCQACGLRLIAFQGPGLQAWAHVDDLGEIPALLGLEG